MEESANVKTSYGLFDVECLQSLHNYLLEITEEHVRRSQKSLGEVRPGETVIGVLYDEATRRLYACADRLNRRSLHLATEDVPEAQEAINTLEVDTLRTLANMARDIFWTSTRIQMNGGKPGIGVRSGWTVVRAPEETKGPSVMVISPFGGPLPEET